jgi:hypothetical protein
LLAIALALLTIFGAGLGRAQDAAFHVAGVRQIRFIETRLSGERVVHHIVQASVTPPPGTAVARLGRFAEALFASNLRAAADGLGREWVWVTFDLGRTLDRANHYNVIFRRTAGGWRRVRPRG